MEGQHWSNIDTILRVYEPVVCGSVFNGLYRPHENTRLPSTVDKLSAHPSN